MLVISKECSKSSGRLIDIKEVAAVSFDFYGKGRGKEKTKISFGEQGCAILTKGDGMLGILVYPLFKKVEIFKF
jgi:hypothetical protein